MRCASPAGVTCPSIYLPHGGIWRSFADFSRAIIVYF
jgi:hypothetical protein